MKNKAFDIVAISLCTIFTTLAFVPWMPATYTYGQVVVGEDGALSTEVHYRSEWRSIWGNVLNARVPGFYVAFFIALSVFISCGLFFLLRAFGAFKPKPWVKRTGIALFVASVFASAGLFLLVMATSGGAAPAYYLE